MDKRCYVFMTRNKKDGVIYIGFTNDIIRRSWEHKAGFGKFTKQYNANQLVYFEIHEDIMIAHQRERTLKHWVRAWRVAIIEKENPDWNDLWDAVVA